MNLSFDRGTLLLQPDGDVESVGIVADLPGVLWDPRVAEYRAPAWCYAELRGALREGGVVVVDELERGWVNRPVGPWRPPELRPYQQAALLAWEGTGRWGTLVMPTGSGKTRTAIAAIAAQGVPALCLVPTRVLLHQWCTELGRFYPGRVGVFGDGSHRVESITVATYESAYRHVARWGDRFQLLVVDEAHHFGGPTRAEALELCAAPYRLGLTATPPEAEAAARVARLIGPVVFDVSVGELAGRWLAEFDLVVLRLALTRAERLVYDREIEIFRRAYRQFRRVAPSASWADFVAAASRSAEGRAALEAWRTTRSLTALTEAKRRTLGALLDRHRASKVLVFTGDNESAYAIARERLVMPITCDVSRPEREAALDAFRRGELRALVSSRVLNEGVDVPDADVAIVVGAAHGEREHVQRVGRILRPSPGKRAVVYELVAAGTSEVRRSDERRQRLFPESEGGRSDERRQRLVPEGGAGIHA